MNMEDIRAIAKSHGVNPGKLFKTELIKTIQIKEGNFDCYSTAYDGVCDQANCLWRVDCFNAALTRKGEIK